jgi:hypothetical protein
MREEQTRKIIKYLEKINNDIKQAENVVDSPSVASKCLQNSRFSILEAMHVLQSNEEGKE